MKEWSKLVVRSMQKINQKYITSVVKEALLEDLFPSGDLTTKIIRHVALLISGKIREKEYLFERLSEHLI